MIYSFLETTVEGPFGTTKTLHYNRTDESTGEELPLKFLGEVDGRKYVYVTENLTKKEFDPKGEIDLKKETSVPAEILEQLKEQGDFSTSLKNDVRRRIEAEYGDSHDLIADAFKLIEFNTVLMARLAADYFGTQELSEEEKGVYAQRNQEFLTALDAGHIILRGNYEDPNEMLQRLMIRYSHIQNIVNEEYLAKLDEVGIK